MKKYDEMQLAPVEDFIEFLISEIEKKKTNDIFRPYKWWLTLFVDMVNSIVLEWRRLRVWEEESDDSREDLQVSIGGRKDCK